MALATVVWHDLECGSYSVDLALWRELAQDAAGAARSARVLDVGAGTGRVTLALARAGHEVTALDRDRDLLDALSERATAAGVLVQRCCADAREFEIEHRDFELCVAPMQTIQLLGGSSGRMAFLRRARAHLRGGALLACAIVTELDPFDCAAGDLGPSPERVRVDGDVYASRATRVQLDGERIRIERERRVLPIEQSPLPRTQRSQSQASQASQAQARRLAPEQDVVELDLLSARELEREARQCGFTPAGVRTIAATDEHVGSEVVIVRA